MYKLLFIVSFISICDFPIKVQAQMENLENFSFQNLSQVLNKSKFAFQLLSIFIYLFVYLHIYEKQDNANLNSTKLLFQEIYMHAFYLTKKLTETH